MYTFVYLIFEIFKGILIGMKDLITIRFSEDELQLLSSMVTGKQNLSGQIKKLIFGSNSGQPSQSESEQIVSLLGTLTENLNILEAKVDSLSKIGDKVDKIEAYLAQISEAE